MQSKITQPNTAAAVARNHPREVHLRILETTDLHVHVLAYDYYADRPSTAVGLARTAELIAQARAEAVNCLLLDNGDFLQGNPMGDYIAQAAGLPDGAIHPVFAAMNQLGYDGATLGNHEFNYGLDFLLEALKGAAFPVVSANIARSLGPSPLQDKTLLPPYVILPRRVTDGAGNSHVVKVGLIGFAPPQIVQWDRQYLEGHLSTRDIVETACALVPQMKAEGADLIIALSHSGIGAADAADGAENASTRLAAVAGIDALLTGHSHLVFPSESFAGMEGIDIHAGTIFGKPAVMAGFYGSHLGVIDLMLDQDANGNWRVVQGRAEARSIQSLPCLNSNLPLEAKRLTASVRADHQATLRYARRPVGRTEVALHSFFAPLAPCPATRIVANAQAAHVARQLAGRPEAALPLLSAASPFKSGGRGGPHNYTHVPAGDMALRHAADLYIFPNTIAAVRLSGAELADWLENGVGLYHQLQPGGQDQLLIDPDFPSYNNDIIFGLSYRIDLTQPARYDRHGALIHPGASRVQDLRYLGQPVDPQQDFVLATNSYRASGCGGFAGTTLDRAIDVGRAPIRELLLRYIAQASPIRATPPDDWHFAPMPGTTVVFDTSPQAASDLAPIAAYAPQPLGLTADGFARFRLHL